MLGYAVRNISNIEECNYYISYGIYRMSYTNLEPMHSNKKNSIITNDEELVGWLLRATIVPWLHLLCNRKRRYIYTKNGNNSSSLAVVSSGPLQDNAAAAQYITGCETRSLRLVQFDPKSHIVSAAAAHSKRIQLCYDYTQGGLICAKGKRKEKKEGALSKKKKRKEYIPVYGLVIHHHSYYYDSFQLYGRVSLPIEDFGDCLV